jgi:hypothetical protein
MEHLAASQHPIVGSWLVTIASNGEQPPYLFTMTPDFCLTMSSPPVLEHVAVDPHAASGPVAMSTGHGAWRSQDGNTAILTFVRLVADGAGTYLGRRVTRALVTVEATSDAWSGQFATAVFEPNQSDDGSARIGFGSISATRIRAELPWEPGAGEDTIRGVKP